MKFDDFTDTLGNTKPYIKAAFEGFAGSGKTFTAAKLAIGLHRRIGSQKPIMIADSETASKFLIRVFRDAKIDVRVKQTRSLLDLEKLMDFGKAGAFDILLIDSISHFWENFTESYKAKKGRDRLEFQDWGIIKPEWKRRFSDRFVMDPLHIIFTGRAAYEYDNEMDDRGKRQVYKSGVKMKAEGETAYEPDVVVYMERREELLVGEKKVWRDATILKDRADLIDGQTFQDPSYDVFAPVVDFLLDSPRELKATPSLDAGGAFKDDENTREWLRRRDIALEKIKAELQLAGLEGRSDDAKKKRFELLREVFGTYSSVEIERMGSEKLEAGLATLKTLIAAMVPKSDTNGGA